ncbi:MAG TPA: VacJ family lipoprotein [Candidatus Limnocylindrales bacterium]|nr:VacJ family lipoprotein [Candidatus Limnocylindrales bacterium]
MARSRAGGWTALAIFGLMALALGGCGTMSAGLQDSLALAAPRADLASSEAPAPPSLDGATITIAQDLPLEARAEGHDQDLTALVGPAEGAEPDVAVIEAAIVPLGDEALSEPVLALADSMVVAQATETSSSADAMVEEYDPLEPFNEVMFEFNRALDRFVLKPIAQAYNVVIPDELQLMISRGFSNINVVPRLVNSLLQGKWEGAGRELARFLINSTVGIGGLWDMARQEWDIQPSKADFGQTLGKWGAGPGAYIVLPFLPPLTVRDGIGYAVDGAMDPLSYVLPFIWDRLIMKIGDIINDRSLNLDLFQGFEETTVDLYAAVRNAYLQRRHRMITEE